VPPCAAREEKHYFLVEGFAGRPARKKSSLRHGVEDVSSEAISESEEMGERAAILTHENIYRRGLPPSPFSFFVVPAARGFLSDAKTQLR